MVVKAAWPNLRPASTKIVNVNVFCGINTVSEPVVEKETNLLNLQNTSRASLLSVTQ